jgi:tRNA-binding EMAP/Myf-like protein
MDDLVVGTILAADDHPGARAPSYLLRVDLGPRGEREATMEPGGHARQELVGTQVVLSLAEGEATVVAARSHAGGSILLRPEREVEPGTVVG